MVVFFVLQLMRKFVQYLSYGSDSLAVDLDSWSWVKPVINLTPYKHWGVFGV